MILKKVLSLDVNSIIETHINIVCAITNKRISKLERDVLSRHIYMSMYEMSDTHYIKGELGISSSLLSNITTSLCKKGLLKRNVKNILIPPVLIPNTDKQEYQIILKNTHAA